MLIKAVFRQFLSEQESKLAPKTYRDYASVIELFENREAGYPNGLSPILIAPPRPGGAGYRGQQDAGAGGHQGGSPGAQLRGLSSEDHVEPYRDNGRVDRKTA